MYYTTRNRRRLTLETLMTMPSEPESKAYYTYSDEDDRVEVLNDTFTLVLSRDVRKNTRIAAEISFQIAKQYPEQDVFYVNTYAGVALMKEAFTKALEKSGLQTLPNVIPEAENELAESEEEEEQVDDDENDWYDDDDDEEEVEGDDDDEYGQEQSVLPNLFIHDVPFGTWDTDRLERDIEDRARHENHSVVVMNSFEFAAMNREQKSRMVEDLLELRNKLGLTILIFSHDMKRDLAAGLPGRGPIGAIAANAGSVQRLNDPFEHLIRHRKRASDGVVLGNDASKRAGNAIVHEAQMRAGQFQKRDDYVRVPKFRNENERIIWQREQEEVPDYHVNPWAGKTQKLGRELIFFAQSSIVRKYFEDHLDYLFTKGEEPTEYELITNTYEAKEELKKYLI